MTLSKKEQAKRLSSKEVARQDKGRDLAEAKQERRGPGRPRKDGSPPQPRAKSVDEAAARIKKESAAVARTETAQDWREPTPGEVAQIRMFMEIGNQPLVELERDLEGMGIVSDSGSPPAYAKKGSIPASEKELDVGAQCTAGTLITFTPSIMPYLAPIGLAFFTIGFIGSRLLIFWRIKKAMDGEAKREREAQERLAQLKSKTAPSVMPGNAAARGELTKIPT